MQEGSIELTAVGQVERDRLAKWHKGQEEHGDIMSDDPLDALYQEFLDGINYAAVLGEDLELADCWDLIGSISATAQRLARVVNYIKNTHPKRQWTPRPAPFR